MYPTIPIKLVLASDMNDICKQTVHFEQDLFNDSVEPIHNIGSFTNRTGLDLI